MILEKDGRVMEAVKCFRWIQSELVDGTSIHDERAQWKFGRWSHE